MQKTIEIPVAADFDIQQDKIYALLHPFLDDKFGFDFADGCVEIQLGALDYLAFDKSVKMALSNGYLNDNSKWLVQEIFNSISAVKSYGLKGGKRIYADYNNERKVQDRKAKEARRQQFFYTEGSDFSKRNHALPAEFENKIVCGDSHDILAKLPDNCIDVVITSPPYNFGLDYADTKDDAHWQQYFDKLFAIFKECVRVLKYGGRAIINVQPLFSDYIPTHHIVSNFFMQQKMIWKGEIMWEKNNYNCKYTAWGSWQSPSNPYLKYTWEFIEIFCKGDLKKEGSRENIDISAEEFKKWVVGKWSVAPERNMKQYGHPAMFPEALIMRAIKLFSFKNDIVLDPFNGAGTTTAVAQKMDRRFLGIDISEEYCETAKKRIGNNIF